MGKGAFMNVTNTRKEALTLFVSNQHCMYDAGAEGSNVSYFNNRQVPANATLPGGQGQYVEAKASSSGGDTCASETSTFDVEVLIGTTPLGTVKITERWSTYDGTSTNTDVIKVDVGRGSDQDVITVTVT